MNFCILQMLYYDRIDTSKGIDGNKASASKECDIESTLLKELMVIKQVHQKSVT